MQLDNLALIATAEALAAFLLFSLLLLYQNRRLKKLIQKLQERMEQLVAELKAAKLQAQKPKPSAPAEHFKDKLNQQIQLTKEHHASLGSEQDIVLDLAPDTPMPLRAAALRYTVLLAEKEAWANTEEGEPPRWEVLRDKYEQVFNFYEDFVPPSGEGATAEEVEALNQELKTAKKRINNLEKFKALYFDLEEKWEASKKNAQTHYDSLSEMASKVEDPEAFENALSSYHAAFNDVAALIEQGIGDPSAQVESHLSEQNAGELRHLRAVAADQHRIITQLQEQLNAASTDEERNSLVDGLKDELSKQQRFIQESETCIQLMEDELNNANKEISQLKDRLKTLPSLKSQLQEARSKSDQYEMKVYALTSENRKLLKKMKEEGSSSNVDHEEMDKLKRELTDLEDRYANLEEKYLDLKLQQ